MKCSIKVDGGTYAVSSINRLVSLIEVNTYDSTGIRGGMFGTVYIDFDRMRDARKVLWKAYKDLRAAEPHKHVATYYPGLALSYDTGRAEIIKL